MEKLVGRFELRKFHAPDSSYRSIDDAPISMPLFLKGLLKKRLYTYMQIKNAKYTSDQDFVPIEDIFEERLMYIDEDGKWSGYFNCTQDLRIPNIDVHTAGKHLHFMIGKNRMVKYLGVDDRSFDISNEMLSLTELALMC